MVKNHLKTIAAPKSWPIGRKEKKYILRANPGPHDLKGSISLNFLLIDLLKIATTKRESVYILRNKEVTVDQKRRRSVEFPIGLFDVIEIKEIKKAIRLLLNDKGKFTIIDAKSPSIKPCKIVGKKLLGGKIQLGFFDGKTMLIDKGDYKVGDTLVIENGKIKEHFKFAKGNVIFLTGGYKKGQLGKIVDVSFNKILYKTDDDKIHETNKKYAYVVGEAKPCIEIR